LLRCSKLLYAALNHSITIPVCQHTLKDLLLFCQSLLKNNSSKNYAQNDQQKSNPMERNLDCAPTPFQYIISMAACSQGG